MAVFFVIAASNWACQRGLETTTNNEVTSTPHVAGGTDIDRGRYLAIIGGCNDCHTDGYLITGGNVPESSWLAGSAMGWRGPWGTSYAKNLRLRAAELTEDQWVALLKNGNGLPPMPWSNVNKMADEDARALHRYLTHLGSVGQAAPVPVGPNQEPAGPYIRLEPVLPRS